MAISADVRPKLSLLLLLLWMILTLASDDTAPESHVSHISEHEILDYEHVSQLRQRRKRGIKAYYLNTDESALSMAEEPPVYAEDEVPSMTTDRRKGRGMKGKIWVIRVGPVS